MRKSRIKHQKRCESLKVYLMNLTQIKSLIKINSSRKSNTSRPATTPTSLLLPVVPDTANATVAATTTTTTAAVAAASTDILW